MEGFTEYRCPDPGCVEDIPSRLTTKLAKKGLITPAAVQRLASLKADQTKQHLGYVLSGADPHLMAWVMANTQTCELYCS